MRLGLTVIKLSNTIFMLVPLPKSVQSEQNIVLIQCYDWLNVFFFEHELKIMLKRSMTVRPESKYYSLHLDSSQNNSPQRHRLFHPIK